MSGKSADQSATPVTLAEFTEVVASALFRAAAAQPAGKPPRGTTTIGIVYRPNGDEIPFLTGSVPGLPPTLPAELRGGDVLSEEGFAKANRLLRDEPERGAALLRHLLADLPGTMAAMFRLDAEQIQAMRDDACANERALGAMRKAAEAVLESGVGIMLDLRLTDEARAEAKKKWCVQSFAINATGSVQGGASGVGGGGTVGGSITFGRCTS